MITKAFVCRYCGSEFQITDYPSRFESGQRKGYYCSKYCAMVGAREEYRPTQGIILANTGYLMSREPNHPNRNKNNQVPIANLVMEAYLGNHMKPNEMVHHIDGNPLNNSIDNLQLMTLGEHVTLHNNLKRRDSYGRFVKNMS